MSGERPSSSPTPRRRRLANVGLGIFTSILNFRTFDLPAKNSSSKPQNQADEAQSTSGVNQNCLRISPNRNRKEREAK